MPLLQVRDLKAFYRDFQALYGIDWALAEGETLAIIGANGAGKSTFLRTVAGLLPARPEAVVFAGRPIGVMMGIGTALNPFSVRPSYKALESLPIADQRQRLRDPDLRRKILAEQPSEAVVAEDQVPRRAVGGAADVGRGARPERDRERPGG